jgi:hypothetical protein
VEGLTYSICDPMEKEKLITTFTAPKGSTLSDLLHRAKGAVANVDYVGCYAVKLLPRGNEWAPV